MTFQRALCACSILMAFVAGGCRQEATDENSDENPRLKKVLTEAIDHSIAFPQGKTLGAVKVRSIGSTNANEWIEISDGKGSVGIPKGKEVMIQILDASSADFSAFDSLGPNDVQEVNLEKSGATDEQVAHLARLVGLTGLNLNQNPITDAVLASLESLVHLKKLALGSTKITNDGLAHLAKLSELQKLWLQDTTIGDAGLKYLSPLTNLQTLILYRAPVTDAGLANLKGLNSLQRLGLEGTQVTNNGLSELQAVKSLTEVSLVDTAVTQDGVDKVHDAMPNCKFILQ